MSTENIYLVRSRRYEINCCTKSVVQTSGEPVLFDFIFIGSKFFRVASFLDLDDQQIFLVGAPMVNNDVRALVVVIGLNQVDILVISAEAPGNFRSKVSGKVPFCSVSFGGTLIDIWLDVSKISNRLI